jgi:hypothetical protein
LSGQAIHLPVSCQAFNNQNPRNRGGFILGVPQHTSFPVLPLLPMRGTWRSQNLLNQEEVLFIPYFLLDSKLRIYILVMVDLTPVMKSSVPDRRNPRKCWLAN